MEAMKVNLPKLARTINANVICVRKFLYTKISRSTLLIILCMHVDVGL